MEHEGKHATLAVVARLVRMRWRRPVKLTAQVGAGALLAMGLVAFRPWDTQRVEAHSPERRPVESGTVESLHPHELGSLFEGAVQHIAVLPGQPVQKGQLLFAMDTSELRAALELARNEERQAREAYQTLVSERDSDLADLKQQVARIRAELGRLRAQQAASERAAQAATLPAPDQAEVEGEEETLAEPLPVEPAPFVEPVDPQLMAEVERRLAEAHAALQERKASWNAPMAEAARAASAARGEARRLSGLIAAARRTSPVDGVVTAVNAAPGQWVESRSPVVRVDDPAGFRLVTLVDEETSERVEAGERLPVQLPGGKTQAKVEKVVRGWDQDVFQYWLWLKPAKTEGLMPGQRIYVAVPEDRMEVASN